MTGIGTVLPGFAGLNVRIPGQNWNFLLRRADFVAEERFGELHNLPVSARQVSAYLPNWPKLKWVRIPENILTRSESLARDLPYQVNVAADFSSRLVHGEVVAAFLKFMAHSRN